MYNCDNCQKTTAEGEKINRIVTKTRRKTYMGTYKDPKTYRYQTIEVGQGNEIVSEMKVCNLCNNKIQTAAKAV